MGVSGDASHSISYGLMVVGCGLLFLTWPMMWLAVGMALAAWLLTAWLADVPIHGQLYAQTLAGCVVMAALATAVRRAVVGRLIAATHAQRQEHADAQRLGDRLAVREREYRDLFDRMLNGFAINEMVYDAQGRVEQYIIVEVNAQFEPLTGLRRADVEGRRVLDVIPDLEPAWIARFAEVVRTGESAHFEDYVAALGKWYEVMAYTMGGRRFAVAFTDVTQRRRNEAALRDSESHYRRLAESNRRLLREVNHRVRNNLASLGGLVGMIRRQVQSVDQFHAAIDQRLQAMAGVHNILAEANWANLPLRELIERLNASMQRSAPRRIAVYLEGPDIAVPPRQVPPLIMTLAELFTNSCKHGAHLRPTGEIDIRWQTTPTQGGHDVELTWHERGGPEIVAAPARSLGCELIEGFVTFELAGQVELAFPPHGASHRLCFHLAADAAPTSHQPAAESL